MRFLVMSFSKKLINAICLIFDWLLLLVVHNIYMILFVHSFVIFQTLIILYLLNTQFHYALVYFIIYRKSFLKNKFLFFIFNNNIFLFLVQYYINSFLTWTIHIYIFFKTIYFSLFTLFTFLYLMWNLLWISIDFELIDQFYLINMYIFLINYSSFSMVNQIRVDCDPLLRIRFRQRQLSRVTLALGKSCSTSKLC